MKSRIAALLLVLAACGGDGNDPTLAELRAGFRLAVPRDGGRAPHRDMEVRWTAFLPGATYRVEVHDGAVLRYRGAPTTELSAHLDAELEPGDAWVSVAAFSERGEMLARTPPRRVTVFAVPDWMPAFATPALDPSAEGFRLTNLIDFAGTPRHGALVLFNRHGELVWWFRPADPVNVSAPKATDRGTVYYTPRWYGADGLLNTGAVEIDWDKRELWRNPPGSLPHHEISDLPGVGRMYLKFAWKEVDGVTYEGDEIEVVDPATNDVVWSWSIFDHFDPRDHLDFPEVQNGGLSGIGLDWSHSNAVVWDEGRGLIWVSVRHLDRLIGIDYPSGDVVVTLGEGGIGGEALMSHQHAPEIQPDGSILLWDNGNGRVPPYSRAIQYAFDPALGTYEVLFEWSDVPPFYDFAVGDADRLPNGNTLVTAGVSGRIIEVDPAGRIVWEKRLVRPQDHWHYRTVLVRPEWLPEHIRVLGD